MTVPLDRTQPVPAPAARGPVLRLSLTPDGSAPGRLDGAWWPHSRDLVAEIPALAAELDERWGRVTRVVVNPTHWPVVPRRIPVAGRMVHVGWFLQEQDENEMMVRSYAPWRLDLLVVPPESSEVVAVGLMNAAADPANTRTASELLARWTTLTATSYRAPQ
ncbi:DUF5994 family protein [Kitasatospora purpeofusca]|uniref:DUF5994 family protein n=1 Tax=Kitasatospora purpeofusca TaxID=67352 RepID=UPI00364B3CA6